MSTRHLYESPDGLVNKALRGIISYNPSLRLDESNRVIFDSTFNKSNVALVSGGGSGHEPACSGYVGKNMLAASVAGDIFASPSAKQILAAINQMRSEKGTILVVLNYTGDCLHFGLANERAIASGHKCRVVICGDDVSIGKKGNLVGRRGLAGQVAVIKVMGGAAGTGASLDQIYNLGVAFSQQIVSVAATLDHCHVPGRKEHSTLGSNELEIGTGPHNEPGYRKISPTPLAEDLVRQLLQHCLDQSDPDRGYVQFGPQEETVVLINNFGGVSYLELAAIVDEFLEQLGKDWPIEPVRVYAGPIQTSLNAVGISCTLVNLTRASRNCAYSVDEIKGFLDCRTSTFWESYAGAQSLRQAKSSQFISPLEEPRRQINDEDDLRVNPTQLERILRCASDGIIAAESDLTKWDTILGDGDCGETLKTGATSIIDALNSTNLVERGSMLAVLDAIEVIIETKMGGTLGGILAIFFASLRGAVKDNVYLAKEEGQHKLWARALHTALESLRRYTPAKVGDRTVMDTLVPFTEAMASGSFDNAVDAAITGAEGTRKMKPKLGRATYVGTGSSGDELPPDPGAWGAMVAIKGIQTGMQEGCV